MSKKIEFNYNGKEYTLEYNREAIMVMEKAGFSLDAYVQKPMLIATMAAPGRDDNNTLLSELPIVIP